LGKKPMRAGDPAITYIDFHGDDGLARLDGLLKAGAWAANTAITGECGCEAQTVADKEVP